MERMPITGPDSPWFTPAMELYRAAFPHHEQRTDRDQLRAMEDPAFHCDAIVEGGAFLGLIFYWISGAFCYVEHFAMAPTVRGRRLGGRALEAFCAEQGTVVLEIDPPVDELSQRRRGFYRRLGFAENPWPHRHPAYRAGIPPHPLVVMTWPRAFRREEYESFARYLRGTVMAYAEQG